MSAGAECRVQAAGNIAAVVSGFILIFGVYRCSVMEYVEGGTQINSDPGTLEQYPLSIIFYIYLNRQSQL